MPSLNFARKIPFRLLSRLMRTVRVPIGETTFAIPLHDSAALAWIHWRRGWMGALFDQLLSSHPGALLDIGANVGQSLADYLSTGLPNRYIGFEPNTHCISFLKKLAAENNLARVTLVPVGLWHRPELQGLFLQTQASADACGSVLPQLRPDTLRHPEWIWSMPFDDLSHSLAITQVSLIKIDVEGAELEALRGMENLLRESGPPVLCEVLHADRGADMDAYRKRLNGLESLVKAHGYTIYRIVPPSGTGTGALVPTSSFPVVHWSDKSHDSCDYLFNRSPVRLPDWPVSTA